MNARHWFRRTSLAGIPDGRGRTRWAAVAVMLALAAGGCGGASDAGREPTSSDAPGKGTVVVNVTDPLGGPASGVAVRFYAAADNVWREAAADAEGRAEFTNASAGEVHAYAVGPDTIGFGAKAKLRAGRVLDLDVALEPAARATGGITHAEVAAGGLSADGRSLEFSLWIAHVPDPRHPGIDPWGNDHVIVQPCTPDPANDLPRYRPDCVSGSDGFDAPYDSENLGAALSITRIEAQGPGNLYAPNYSAALLMDQGAGVILSDPADARLFAAKYFLSHATDGNLMVLAAFAADDPVTGQVSLLPEAPASLYPVENPQFVADGRSYFPTVDQLAAAEGGASPLFAAIDRTIDFVAHRASGDTRAVVAVTDGRDDMCGSETECRQARDAVIAKSRDKRVDIVTIGFASPSRAADHETLGLLGSRGAAFWADDPKQLAPILATVDSVLAQWEPTAKVTFRIQSPVPGAFAPGRTVMGTVTYATVCPWECEFASVPFVVRIP